MIKVDKASVEEIIADFTTDLEELETTCSGFLSQTSINFNEGYVGEIETNSISLVDEMERYYNLQQRYYKAHLEILRKIAEAFATVDDDMSTNIRGENQ